MVICSAGHTFNTGDPEERFDGEIVTHAKILLVFFSEKIILTDILFLKRTLMDKNRTFFHLNGHFVFKTDINGQKSDIFHLNGH